MWFRKTSWDLREDLEGFMRVSIVSMEIWGFEERSEVFLRVCGGCRMVSVNCKGCSTGGFKVSEELLENWRDVRKLSMCLIISTSK